MKIRYLTPFLLLIFCGCNLIGDSQKDTFARARVDVSRDLAERDLNGNADQMESDVMQRDVGMDQSDGFRDMADATFDATADADMKVEDMSPTFCQESFDLAPILYWSFDNSLDGGRSFPNLMKAGVLDAYASDSVESAKGAIGNGLKFNGVDSTISAEHDPILELAEGTLSLWFEKSANFVCTDTVTGCGLFSKDANGQGQGGHITVAVTAENTVLVRLQSIPSTYVAESMPVATTGLHHVAVSFGNGGLRLFLDGIQVGFNAYQRGLVNSTVPTNNNVESIGVGWSKWNVVPGTMSPKEGFFDGLIDEVLFFDRQLSGFEIQSLSDGCSD